MKKIFRKLSLKEEKVVNLTTGKKTLKKVVGLLGLVAFVTLCVINFKIGSADYNQKSRASLSTLEALANGEGGGGETGSPNGQDLSGGCKTDYTSTYNSEIRVYTYYCTSGSGKKCNYGTKTYNNGVAQAGSSVTTYTCKS
jgi:hypothetical protein